jgi:DNA-binding XRE family transcriptional regulator
MMADRFGRGRRVSSGNQIKAVTPIGADQATIAAAAGLTRQTLVRLEESGSNPVVSRDWTMAAVLVALGVHGVIFVPHEVVLVS